MTEQSHYWAYTLRKNGNTNLKRYLPPSVLSSSVYNSQDMKAIQMPNGWMDKEDVVCIYTMEYYSATKKWNPAICSNVDGPREYYA